MDFPDPCPAGSHFQPAEFDERDEAIVMQQIFYVVGYLHGGDLCHLGLRAERFFFAEEFRDRKNDPWRAGPLR